MNLLSLLWKIFKNKYSMFLKFIMMVFWVALLAVFIALLLKGLWEGNVNYIRIGIIGIIVSLFTVMAIYKDY